MEGIAAEYYPNIDNLGSQEEKYEFNSYTSGDNKQDTCDSYAHMVHLLKNHRIRSLRFWNVQCMGGH